MYSKNVEMKLNSDGSIDQKSITHLPYLFKSMKKLHTARYDNIQFRPSSLSEMLKCEDVVPLLLWEFQLAQRQLPIVFSLGQARPLALMAVTKGVNMFIDEDGFTNEPVYIPLYAQLYPFISLPDPEDPSLGTVCFDPSCPAIGESVNGVPLYKDGQPTESHDVIMAKCREYHEDELQTAEFVEWLEKYDLLREIEIEISDEGGKPYYPFSGFQIIDEDKLLSLRGDVLRAFNRRGFLLPIFAHLMSFHHLKDLVTRQVKAGRYSADAANVGGGLFR